MFLAFLLFISIAPAVYTGWRVEGMWAWRLAQIEYKRNRKRGYGLDYDYSIWEFSGGDGIPGGFAHFCGILMGLIAATVWPILAIGLLLKATHRISGGGLSYTPKEIQAQQQRDRIKELEKELNLTR